MIKSSKFSFVRFEHPQVNDISLDIPYALPVWDKLTCGFHFVVEDDRRDNLGISLAMADTSGGLLFSLNSPAVPLNYRYRLDGLSDVASYDLQSIKINTTTIVYNIPVTAETLKEILEDDWGVELIDDYVVFPSVTPFEIGITENGTPALFNGIREAHWHEGYASVVNAALPTKSRFTLALMDPANNAILGYSNEFYKAPEAAYTSLVTYGADSSAFEFTYKKNGTGPTGQWKNIVRLPFYLSRPEWPAKRVVNKQANGSTRLISSSIEKQYGLDTEHMPEVFHECMRAMLLHNSIVIENVNIREQTVKVIEADNYTVAWNDDLKLSYAPGRGTLKVASYGFANSNC